jgi:hypothetical protein
MILGTLPSTSSQEMNLKNRETERGTTLTRRIVLTGGVGCALTLLLPEYVLGSAENRSAATDTRPAVDGGSPELYAFRGSSENSIVMAATWTALSGQDSQVRIHAGERHWAVEIPAGLSNSTSVSESGCRIFRGFILDRTAGRNAQTQAVVIEAPSQIISSGGATPVWAERISRGTRLRFGSPFMARLVAKSIPVAKLYHASSPAEDGEELRRLVAEAISVNARQNGYMSNALPYGRRIASAITPDALRFDPQLPVGFTFAAQNGRHPKDAANSVVDTVLNGALAAPDPQTSLPLTGQFPYFPQPSMRT